MLMKTRKKAADVGDQEEIVRFLWKDTKYNSEYYFIFEQIVILIKGDRERKKLNCSSLLRAWLQVFMSSFIGYFL